LDRPIYVVALPHTERKHPLVISWLGVQPAKSKAYITEHLRDARLDELGGDVSNGTIEDQEGNTHFGIAACNIPIGTEGFIKAYLYQKKESILTGYANIMNLLDPGRCSHPDIPICKCYGSLSTFACSLQVITGCVIFVLTTRRILLMQLMQLFALCSKRALE
jgi:hypothetical protein